MHKRLLSLLGLMILIAVWRSGASIWSQAWDLMTLCASSYPSTSCPERTVLRWWSTGLLDQRLTSSPFTLGTVARRSRRILGLRRRRCGPARFR